MTILKFLCFFCVFLGIVLITSCHSNKIATSPKSETTTTVEPNVEVAINERGVLFRRFAGGLDTSKVFLPGKYFVSPFDRFIKYNIDTKRESDVVKIVSRDSIEMELSIEYAFKPIPEKIALIEYYIGSDYLKFGVKPKLFKIIQKYFINDIAKDISLNKKEGYCEKRNC